MNIYLLQHTHELSWTILVLAANYNDAFAQVKTAHPKHRIEEWKAIYLGSAKLPGIIIDDRP